MPHESPEKFLSPFSGPERPALQAGLGRRQSQTAGPALRTGLDPGPGHGSLLQAASAAGAALRPFRAAVLPDDDLDGRQLVFAATGNAGVNRHIAYPLPGTPSPVQQLSVRHPAEAHSVCPPWPAPARAWRCFSTGGWRPGPFRRWKGELTTWLEAPKMVRLSGTVASHGPCLARRDGGCAAVPRSGPVAPCRDHATGRPAERCLRCHKALLPPSCCSASRSCLMLSRDLHPTRPCVTALPGRSGAACCAMPSGSMAGLLAGGASDSSARRFPSCSLLTRPCPG